MEITQNKSSIEKKPTFSIIIPCYNEEAGIPHLSEKLTGPLKTISEKYTPELIFVDDGSTDKTNELLHHHFSKLPNTKIIKHEQNKNLGAALKTGFSYATGDYIAALDSDCTYHPQLLTTMMEMFDTNTDIVTVSPYHPKGKVNNVPAYRIFLSKSISRIYRILLSSDLYTFTAMVRVYKKPVIQNIQFKSNTFLSVTEIMIKSLLKGYHVKELPAELNVRKFGASKMKTFRVIIDHLGLIGRIIRYKIVHKEL